MKQTITLFFCLLSLSVLSFAQGQVQKEKMTTEDKQEKSQARTSRINDKNDYALFRKQIQLLKEYSDEKKKVPKLQAENKMPVKIVIAIDSIDETVDATKPLTGYIVQNIGDNATLMYDLTYDRALKKIVSVKRTQEAIDADKADQDEKEEKAADKKTTVKPATAHKKSKDDDDDDEPEEKPSKTKDED